MYPVARKAYLFKQPARLVSLCLSHEVMPILLSSLGMRICSRFEMSIGHEPGNMRQAPCLNSQKFKLLVDKLPGCWHDRVYISKFYQCEDHEARLDTRSIARYNASCARG